MTLRRVGRLPPDRRPREKHRRGYVRFRLPGELEQRFEAARAALEAARAASQRGQLSCLQNRQLAMLEEQLGELEARAISEGGGRFEFVPVAWSEPVFSTPGGGEIPRNGARETGIRLGTHAREMRQGKGLAR